MCQVLGHTSVLTLTMASGLTLGARLARSVMAIMLLAYEIASGVTDNLGSQLLTQWAQN